MNITRFNVRIYGVLKNSLNQILVSDELVKKGSLRVTKFPGGGLEFGEGLREALQREFFEETQVKVQVKEHIYTSDFFVPSAFDNDSQVIAVYYWVDCLEWQQIKVTEKKFDFNVPKGTETESFRWVEAHEMKNETDISLPTDAAVLKIITSLF
ncbi:MAG TPA: NUDIX domain-containing protein [Chitinophagales bacterium]|nr:NUDIX domain-containing protein [Chitinophagales bacterium]HRP39460.1 NUDIX domain-containing protein [Chitinophagales bacterium]